MRILLLSPPYVLFPRETKFASPPLGLSYIAALLEKNNYEVKIIDAVVEAYKTVTDYDNGTSVYGMSKNDILNTLDEYQPDVLGISFIFSTLNAVLSELGPLIKEKFPRIKIVLGGTHPTVMADTLIKEPYVDYIIRGEGEFAFLKLLKYLQGNQEIENVNNLTWYENGEVRSNAQEFIEDIDKLPHPARHLLNMEGYIQIGALQGGTNRGKRATTMITSRGCPAKCVFCSIHSVWGRKFRGHSPEYVLEELQELHEKYKINHIVFEDDNITLNKKRVESIFQGMIDKEFNFTWDAPNGIALWTLDENLLTLCRKSGCYLVSLAIESGDPHTLKNLINKPLKLEKVEPIVNKCRELGIRTIGFFVIGLPGETMEAMQRSLDYAVELKLDFLGIMIATPYPGTRLYDICQKNGYLPDNFQVEKLITRIGQISTPDFTPEDVENLVNIMLARWAIKNPVKTIRLIIEKFRASPKQVTAFIVKKLAIVIVGALKK